jgi:hypothetical protein
MHIMSPLVYNKVTVIGCIEIVMMPKRETGRDRVSDVRRTETFQRPLTFRMTVQFFTDVRRGFGPVSFPQSTPRYRSRYNEPLGVGRSGDRISVGARFSAWGPPSLLYNGYWVLLDNKPAGPWC